MVGHKKIASIMTYKNEVEQKHTMKFIRFADKKYFG